MRPQLPGGGLLGERRKNLTQSRKDEKRRRVQRRSRNEIMAAGARDRRFFTEVNKGNEGSDAQRPPTPVVGLSLRCLRFLLSKLYIFAAALREIIVLLRFTRRYRSLAKLSHCQSRKSRSAFMNASGDSRFDKWTTGNINRFGPGMVAANDSL